ncbi:MAG: hypothetical protein WDZ91_15270 [Paenibacillaceae bacterium]
MKAFIMFLSILFLLTSCNSNSVNEQPVDNGMFGKNPPNAMVQIEYQIYETMLGTYCWSTKNQSALTFTSFSAAAGNSLKELDQKSLDFIYKEAVPTDTTFTEVLKSRRNDPKLDKIKQSKRNSKKIGTLKEKYNKASLTELMNVEISLDFNASEEKFEEKLKDLKLVFKKTKHQTYEVFLTTNQLELVESMDEVMLLSDPDDLDATLAEDEDQFMSLNKTDPLK